MKIVKLLVMGSIVMSAGIAQAQKKGLMSEFSGQGYGQAGCGLGSVVMGKDGNQILASTTNATSGTQTFGITFGTSNCTQDGLFKGAAHVPAFIEVNKLALANDAAKGEGESLASLAKLMGCDSQVVGTQLQQNYDKIFVDTQMSAQGIQQNIETVLAPSCGA